MSSLDDRDVVAKCLNLGATDYLVKPLRHNELRLVWTRVWWWRRVSRSWRGISGIGGGAALPVASRLQLDPLPNVAGAPLAQPC